MNTDSYQQSYQSAPQATAQPQSALSQPQQAQAAAAQPRSAQPTQPAQQSAPAQDQLQTGGRTRAYSRTLNPSPSQTRKNFGSSFISKVKHFFQNTSWQKMLGLAAILVAVYLGYRFLFAQSTLTVVGEGKHQFEANQAEFIVSFVNAGTDANQAIEVGKAGIDNLISTVQSIAPNSTIKKAFYQVSPAVDDTGATQYQVINAFSVQTGAVDKIDQLVSTLYANGARTVTTVNFTHTDEEQMAQEARRKAVQNAKQEARRIARSAGKRVGRMVAISDDQKRASSSIGSGEDPNNYKHVTITKQVSIVYKLW